MTFRPAHVLLLGAVLAIASHAAVAAAGGPETRDLPVPYPVAERGEHADVYHGHRVVDPYRWLETLDSPATRRFMKAQDDLARERLSGPRRDHFERRLEELWSLETFGRPQPAGDRLFYTRTAGDRAQPVLVAQHGRSGDAKVLLDPNRDRELAGQRITSFVPSPDGRSIAIGTAPIGSRWATWSVLDTATGRRSELRLTGLNRPSVAWAKDGSGFFYTRQNSTPREGDGEGGGGTQSVVLTGESVYFHRIGGSGRNDRRVYRHPDPEAERNYLLRLSEDGRWLVLTESRLGDLKSRVLGLDLDDPEGAVRPLAGDGTSAWTVVGDDPTDGVSRELLCVTDESAPNGRVVAVSLLDPESPPREVVPEGRNALRGANLVDGRLLTVSSRDAVPHVEIRSIADGVLERTVELPSVSYLGGFAGRPDDRYAYYSLSGLTDPGTVYELDPRTGASSVFLRGELPFSPEEFVTEQVFFASEDGTRVPMFVTRRADLDPRGRNPLILYGYGAWGWSAVPWFQPGMLAWLEAGGVYALANVRGGGEYGDAWHRAGILRNKQNAIDDFVAAAEWLVAERWTKPERLAAHGGSASGPLAGAAVIQRPDLFGAAMIDVPALDMLRLGAFTGGRGWAPEFGDVEDAEDFAALYAYSPYHRIEEGSCYPATLVTAGELDETTVPSHAYKFVAALQHAQSCAHPVYLQVAWGAGHAVGANREESRQTLARQLSFLADALGLGVRSAAGALDGEESDDRGAR